MTSNPFWRNTRTEKHMPDPLDPPAAPPAPPREERREGGRGCVCGFCEAKLAPNGDVLAMSTRAKKLRDLDDDNERLRAQVTSLTAEVDRLKAIAAPPAPTGEPPREKKGFIF
jgi:hypothetical protein